MTMQKVYAAFISIDIQNFHQNFNKNELLINVLKFFKGEIKNTMSMQEKINGTSDAKLRESAMLKMYKNDKNFRADKLNNN